MSNKCVILELIFPSISSFVKLCLQNLGGFHFLSAITSSDLAYIYSLMWLGVTVSGFCLGHICRENGTEH